MILKTIFCGVCGCKNTAIEAGPNKGWPGWGHVVGLIDDESMETTCHVCPKHLQLIKKVLEGDINDMD